MEYKSTAPEGWASAHDDGEVEALKAAARQRMVEGQTTLDLGLAAAGIGVTGPVPPQSRSISRPMIALSMKK